MLFPLPQENVNSDDSSALPRHVRARRSAEPKRHPVKTLFHRDGFGLACGQEQSHRCDPGGSDEPSLLAPSQVHPPGAPGARKSPSGSAVSEDSYKGVFKHMDARGTPVAHLCKVTMSVEGG